MSPADVAPKKGAPSISPAFFSELRRRDFHVQAVRDKGGNGYTINPLERRNVRALLKANGIERFSKGVRFVLSKEGTGLPEAFQRLPLKLAGESTGPEGFLRKLGDLHGAEVTFRLPDNRIVIVPKRPNP